MIEKSTWAGRILETKRLSCRERVILDVCRGKRVLDVGCVGQRVPSDDPDWLHSKLRAHAQRVDGVDIDTEGIARLRHAGLTVYHYDELLESGNRYDVVVMADVIEHVNDPVSFLDTYRVFLVEGGQIVMTTPNSNRAINAINVLLRNDYAINAQHTMWMCPKSFLEVARRASDVEVDRFYWLSEPTTPRPERWINRVKHSAARALCSVRPAFAPAFAFTLRSTATTPTPGAGGKRSGL
ncbi:MAG: class I SAM-dependent methyltransferase [Nannocystaceae bacterium]